MKTTYLFMHFIVMILGIISTELLAETATLTGNVFYPGRIVLPKHAVFEATLEDVSLMDVPPIVIGSTTLEPAGNIPISFTIQYKTEDIQKRHRYNVRGKISVDGRLIFVTDTGYPVLTDKEQKDLSLRMKWVKPQ